MTPEAKERLERILTNRECYRIWSVQVQTVYIDLHGLTCKEARVFLSNVINLIDRPANIKVIHGYRRGTAL